MKPELLSVRAVNQYRRRDILAYIGLRYYLESKSTRSDKWAREVSTHLVTTRDVPIYFRSYHYKEMGEGDSVVYRNIYIPGPNEILAESTLLQECSLSPSFSTLPCVYSYKFPAKNNKEGVFRSYFPGFKERHISIAKACANTDGAMVRYTDIRKFYPNISKELALKHWRLACDSSTISSPSRELGERLLIEHNKTAIANGEGSGVLIGPMLSHLIANLVLGTVDKIMFEKMEKNYWRYVDDIVLVGDADQINTGRELLSSILSDMGLSLHTEGKDFIVDSNVWLEGANDFDDSETKVWTSLITHIKGFLLTKSNERGDLARAFLEHGVNIPLLDYSNAIAESSYVEKVSSWLAKYSWFRKSLRRLTVKDILGDAIKAREIYANRMSLLLANNPEITGYARKRLIPKLRFYAGRLMFLGTPDILSSVSIALINFPELSLQSVVMSAIESRDVSSLLRFGTNAVQAAAQVLRMHTDSVNCSLSLFGEVELQGLAILRLNGIEIDFINEAEGKTIVDPLNQFATGNNSAELMKSQDLFIKEISCLRGVESPFRHISMLDTAFDKDEQLIFDVINQLHDSSF